MQANTREEQRAKAEMPHGAKRKRQKKRKESNVSNERQNHGWGESTTASEGGGRLLNNPAKQRSNRSTADGLYRSQHQNEEPSNETTVLHNAATAQPQPAQSNNASTSNTEQTTKASQPPLNTS